MKLALIDCTNIVMRWVFARLTPEVAKLSMLRTEPAFEEQKKAILDSVDRVLHEFCDHVGATHAILAFDSNLASWRSRELPEYKAHRAQGVTGPWSNRAAQHLKALGWLCQRAPGYEADDVIAALVERAKERAHIHVLSGDSDLLMLIQPNVHLWTFGKDGRRFVEATETQVFDRFGVHPRRLRDFKALVGEKTDGIPGVKGIGPVNARKILEVHGSLEAALEANAIKPELHSAARLAYRLIGLSIDADVAPIHPLTCFVPDRETVRA